MDDGNEVEDGVSCVNDASVVQKSSRNELGLIWRVSLVSCKASCTNFGAIWSGVD